ncbi:MAG TPA: peptide-methionine (R)-S-oxide reductase MsrB [Polyangiaceae bacterium LLY-WYZ-14_1]|nr:peptide-methionine (R)-S-oxide reductase MsrB [Polyangiaceae bacterium LLY-WYZ-14_1]
MADRTTEGNRSTTTTPTPGPSSRAPAPMPRTDDEWARKLTPDQFRILRQKGTEPPFSGLLNDEKRPGVFRCAGCGADLFRSETKYESGSGWPSFWEPVSPDAVALHEDHSHGMIRTEVTCARCGGHLGHVFPDGPQPTGERFCINSLSLDFEPKGG